jgi:hypothetical protein
VEERVVKITKDLGALTQENNMATHFGLGVRYPKKPPHFTLTDYAKGFVWPAGFFFFLFAVMYLFFH